MRKALIAVLETCAVLSAALSCGGGDRYVQISGYAQGGTYSVKFNMRGADMTAEALRDGVDSLLVLVDTTLSGYDRGSMLSRFNAGETVVPNELFMDIYEYAADMFVRSGGAVDVAAGPLFDAWGFGFTSDSLPSVNEVAEIMSRCGMGRLRRDMRGALQDGRLAPAVLLSDEAAAASPDALPRLNYNAIAQGYTCDIIASYLREHGVRDMLVDIGEIFCDGLNPDGVPWALGIDRPVDGNDEPGADLKGIWRSDGGPHGVVTSGNYRKYYIKDGRKYSHSIDPRTGFPAESNLLSATVSAADAATADAVATWCMVIGLEASKDLLSGDGLEGCLIYDEDGEMRMWTSPGFEVEDAG